MVKDVETLTGVITSLYGKGREMQITLVHTKGYSRRFTHVRAADIADSDLVYVGAKLFIQVEVIEYDDYKTYDALYAIPIPREELSKISFQ